MSALRMAILGALLMGGWLLNRELFAIVAGVTAAWAVVKWRTQRDEDAPETADSAVLERVSERVEQAAVVADTLHTRISGRKTAIQLEGLPALGGGRIGVFTFQTPLLNPPLPFCFTLRPERPLLARDRLVSNSNIARTPFEYALHPVALAAGPLSERHACVSNQPRMMARMLRNGLEDTLSEVVATHTFRLEELTWDGGTVWIRLLPVAEPDLTDVDSLLADLAPLIEALDEHVAQGSLQLATAASEDPPPQ